MSKTRRRIWEEEVSLHSFITSVLLCSSGKPRPGRYLRNPGSMGWQFASRGYMTQRLLCENTHHLHYSDCANSECSSDRCTWHWYFSLTSSATKQVPASRPAPSFCLVLSPLPRPASFNLPELRYPLYSHRRLGGH
jgi:hypothetical protein